MIRILFGVFMLLHGGVHLLYFGHSARYFELKQGMVWPDGAWVLSRLFGNDVTRNLVSLAMILTAVGFVVGGVGVFAGQSWWRQVVVCTAAFSTITYILAWNGSLQNLDGQGGVGILINLAILFAVFILRWPAFRFS